MQSKAEIRIFCALEKLILRLRTSSEHRTTVHYVMGIIDYLTYQEPQKEHLVIIITKTQIQVHFLSYSSR